MSRANSILHDKGQAVVLLAAFVAGLAGMLWVGWLEQIALLYQHYHSGVGPWARLFGSSFQSPLFENWESEFLLTSCYAIMLAILFQRESAKSKDPDKVIPDHEDRNVRRGDTHVLWPVRVSGAWSFLYARSMRIALLPLFAPLFAMRWLNSAAAAEEEAAQHGQQAFGLIKYLSRPRLSLGNIQGWRPEFLFTAVLVVLSIIICHQAYPNLTCHSAPFQN
jgi:hypothetical protein